MNRIIIIIAAVTLLLSSPLMADSQKQARVLGESPLYSKPYSDSKIKSTLQANSEVSVIKRKGGWYQVKVNKKMTGWMRMSKLRFGEATSADKQAGNISGLQQTIKLFKTGRSESSGVTVATGIRGLDAADLQNSKPNHEELKRLIGFATDQEGAKKFAAKAKLKSHDLAYIQVEKPKVKEVAPEDNYWGNDDDY